MENKRLKLLLITQIAPPVGGIATWSEKYIKYLENENVDFDIVNTAAIGNRSLNLMAKKSLLTEMKRALKIWKSICNRVRRDKFDIAHINVVGTKIGLIRDYISICLLGNKTQKIIQFHSNIEDQLGNGYISKILLKMVLNKIDAVFVLNNSSKNVISSMSNKKCFVVNNFIDNQIIRRKPKIINEHIKKIVFTGHILQSKGIGEIIEASKAFPEICFELIGKNVDVYSEKNYGENIKFLGEISYDDVMQHLDVADAFLFPSYTEGFSLSMTEAMARGLPIIATDVGANKAMLEEQGGIIVRCQNVNDIVRAIRRISDRNVREKMSIWNIDKVSNNFTVNIVCNRFLNLYNEVIEGIV